MPFQVPLISTEFRGAKLSLSTAMSSSRFCASANGSIGSSASQLRSSMRLLGSQGLGKQDCLAASCSI